MKHNPIIRLQTAQLMVRRAEEACVHWDYENTQGSDHVCCRHMRACQNELHNARRACNHEIHPQFCPTV